MKKSGTLVDGMSVGRQPGARLDCREVLDMFFRWTSAVETLPDCISAWNYVVLCSTAVYVLAMGHFGPVAPALSCT